MICSLVGSLVCHSAGNAGGCNVLCNSRHALSASEPPPAACTKAVSSSDKTGASFRFTTVLFVEAGGGAEGASVWREHPKLSARVKTAIPRKRTIMLRFVLKFGALNIKVSN